MNVSRKMLGDAGEHYALAQFTLAGLPCAKMPDNWEGYDLAVESGAGLIRVSVKTRKHSSKWKNAAWFTFDERKACDWLAFIFVVSDDEKNASIRAWILPFDTAVEHAGKIGQDRKDPWLREVSWKRLNGPELLRFEGNWKLREV
ncbi:MAG: hypothetical protein JJU00_19640 [Opitutales bacterium]|nr:hypothetical protein [Opitutales bacterium]